LRLLPLIEKALAQQADVAVYAPGSSEHLPPAVELLPVGQLAEALQWANFLAMETPPENLRALRSALGLARGKRSPCAAQVLLCLPFACGGPAECGVCAVQTRRGWALGCKDGPVFDLDSLEVE
jgi:hypothetical protein